MARIAGVNLLNQKRLEVGLTYIYEHRPGHGTQGLRRPRPVARDEGQRTSRRGDDEAQRHIDTNLQVEGDLRRERSQSVKRLQEIGAYRGVRHRRGLPVNGQRIVDERPHPEGPAKSVGRKKKATT